MSTTRMNSKEIDKHITSGMLKRFRQAANNGPDLTDPDAPDFSELMTEEIRRLGRPKKAFCKKLLTIRVEPLTLYSLRMSGKGWQTRVSDWIDDGVRKGVLVAPYRKP